MRQAFTLLGIMTFIVAVGVFIAFERAEAPTEEPIIGDNPAPMTLTLTSPEFEDGGTIPSRFTCDGGNVNPELRIAGVPEGTASLVLLMDDPDIPDSVKESRGIEKFDHWAVYNIPADTTVVPEAAIIGTEALNSTGKEGYVGPCPPDREHRYIFRLYALSGTLNFIKAPTLDEVEIAARGMTLESVTLMGRYERVVDRE
jgi:hypothetical protein